jgi:pyridoxamine 5'-phosphate oxidase
VLPAVVVERFHQLLDRARIAGEPEPTAMSLATADASGHPSVRIVLLKQFDRDGLVFYTNTLSDKGRQLEVNPRAAVCVHWKHLDMQVQVRVEGSIEPVTPAEADEYFATRPRGSQVGAWASPQSRPMAERSDLETRIAAIESRFDDRPIPRPPHWSGYRLCPDRIEFWHGREFRLHDRHLFTRDGDQWHESRLYP